MLSKPAVLGRRSFQSYACITIVSLRFPLVMHPIVDKLVNEIYRLKDFLQITYCTVKTNYLINQSSINYIKLHFYL